MPIHRAVFPLLAALLAGGCNFEATLEKDSIKADRNGVASAKLVIKAEAGTELTVEGSAGGLPDAAFVASASGRRSIRISDAGATEIDLKVECVDAGMNQGTVSVSSGGVTRTLPFTVECPAADPEGTIAYIEVYQGPPTYWAKYSPYGPLIEDYGPVRLPGLQLDKIDAAAERLAERHPTVRDVAQVCQQAGCWHPEPYWTEDTKGIVFSLWRRQAAFAVGYREASAGSGVDHQAVIEMPDGRAISLAPELERSVVRDGEAVQEVVYVLDGKEYLAGRTFKAYGAAPASAHRGQAQAVELFGQDGDTGEDSPNEGGPELGHHIMFVSMDVPFDLGVEPDDAPWADTILKIQERVKESCYPERVGVTASGASACLGPPDGTEDFDVYLETAKDYYPVTSQWGHYAAEGSGQPARLVLDGGDWPAESWMEWHESAGDNFQDLFNLFSGWSQTKHHVEHAACPGDSSIALYSTHGLRAAGGGGLWNGRRVALAMADALSAEERGLRADYFAGEAGILRTHAGQSAMSVGSLAHELGHSAFGLGHAPPYGNVVKQFADVWIRSVLARDPEAPPHQIQWALHFEAPADYGPTVGYERGWWFSAGRFRDGDSLSLTAGSPGLHDIMGGSHDVFISDIFYRQAVLETIHRSQPPPYMRANWAGNRRGCAAAASSAAASKRGATDAAPRSLALVGYLGPDGTPRLLSASPSHMPPWGGGESGEFLLELTDPNGNVVHAEWISPVPLPILMGGHQRRAHGGAAGPSRMWRARVPHPGERGALLMRDSGGSIALSVDELRVLR